MSRVSVFLNDLLDDGWINVLLNQLTLIELSRFTVGFEFNDPFINQHSALFELPELLSCPILLIGWLEQIF